MNEWISVLMVVTLVVLDWRDVGCVECSFTPTVSVFSECISALRRRKRNRTAKLDFPTMLLSLTGLSTSNEKCWVSDSRTDLNFSVLKDKMPETHGHSVKRTLYWFYHWQAAEHNNNKTCRRHKLLHLSIKHFFIVFTPFHCLSR